MGDTRSVWSSKIVREHTASRLERLKQKQELKKRARSLNADVMSAKTSATRVAAVFSDTDRCVRCSPCAAPAAPRRRIPHSVPQHPNSGGRPIAQLGGRGRAG